jgi:eukaryotic-like serine/threonine-protein kinase
MLTGRSAFVGGDLNGILKQVLTDPTPPPSTHNPKLPRAFDHIVGKALAKDPAERYQDADEMARDLRLYDRVDLDTPAPAPLPALEHPTNPKAVPATDAVRPPLVPLAASAQGPWWKRRVVWSTAVAAVVVVALATLLVPRKDTAPAAAAPMLSKSGTIAPPATSAAPPPSVARAPVAIEPPSPSRRATATAPVAVSAARNDATPAPTGETAASAATTAVPPPMPVVPKPTGRVLLAVQPWGEIYVDGKKRGISPPTKELRLPPGQHVVEIRNGTFPPHSETIQVNADEAVRITHNF